ncbi:MAG: hypothetical protein ACD_2C00175G0005 [uncultured bacterium (gcode 4)]|uniref:Uncharacterized protein n=1 Tax=uncultured bacterium (gcode 4) TaxID=1234023 RepID=K2G556_9BACT|nr:MAG: hypothetical protein ACD_2C00175G0005 [uncultured bacterium (gcode 4)]
MNYILNSKNRKLKYKLHLLVDRLSFNFLNLTASQKIVFLGIILGFFSLFFTWFTVEYDGITAYSSFNIVSGYVGYFISVILLFLAFLILSNKNKEKLKTKTGVIFHDYTIIVFSWIIIFLLTLVIFNSIRGLTTFSKWISIWKGIIFEVVGAIFILLWGVLSYKEKKQEILSKIYIENSKFEAQQDLEDYKDILNSPTSNKSNMSLPI